MIRAVAGKVASLIPVLLGISVITFFLIRLVPGDIVNVMMGEDLGDPQYEATLRRLFGLDQPAYVQFVHWFAGVLHGDLGEASERANQYWPRSSSGFRRRSS